MAEKLAFETKSLTEQNIEKLKQLFPEIITEASGKDGKIRHSVDFEKLKQVLSGQIAETHETYDFIWAGKGKAMQIASEPIRKTLRPCQEESINWDNTENIYIEGDNLDALKLLQESYLGKVKMIYIDPPYNTGNDFIYKDKFSQTQQEYEKQTEVKDEEGNILFKNLETNGRFHSDWCSMIYPRLKIARNLLAEDGVIFVSIDYHENYNLRKMLNEIFGESNFIGEIYWESKTKSQNTKTSFNKLQPKAEMIFVYSKSLVSRFNLVKSADKEYPFEDEKGLYREYELEMMSAYGQRGRKSMSFEIRDGANIVSPDKDKQWKLGKDKIKKYQQSEDLFIRDGKVIIKIRPGSENTESYDPFWGCFFGKAIGTAETAKKELTQVMESDCGLETVKPVELIERLIYHATGKESLIVDFFSGSATTAHAVMKLNAKDGGKRKYIMVQLQEFEKQRNGINNTKYKNICEIGKERIRRAAAQIQKDNPNAPQFDGGFRVFKVADSNMKDVYYSPEKYSQDMLSKMTTNIKEDRTALDLLYGCILQLGLPISCKHSQENFENIDIYSAHTEESLLVACFANNITPKVVEHIAAKQPDYAVFRDSCFKASQDKINLEERFKKISPNTKIKVI